MKVNVNRPVVTMYLMTLLLALSKTTLAKDATLDDAISKGLRETSTATALNHLSRKRRYLEFPEGTSLQLVLDLVMGVVDYANYITVSITIAMAYELPSKPPSELLEDVRERLKDGTFGMNRNDTTTNIKYVDAGPELKRYNNVHPKIPWHLQKATFDEYYTSHNFNPFHQFLKKSEQLRFTSQAANYPRWSSGLRTINPTMRNVNHNTDPIKEVPSFQRTRPNNNHRIYPILGKRIGSYAIGGPRNGIAKDIPSKYDRIHVRHQRSSRHKLYKAIETYLDRKHMDGHNCVLRALCETGQKLEEQVPGSFVSELMRAVFTMPEALEDNIRPGYKEERYDAAHALKGDCADHYHECGHSLWSSNFVV